jgi:BirA family transcriptional regulator, biotin operon repressor / biotin---[acetyl-CoA-carboxylase] ligase
VILDQRTRAHLAATTRFGDIREFGSIASTNTYLLEAARGGAAEGVVAVADHQTQGRGRLGRVWTAPPGTALLVSVLLRPVGLPAGRRHLVTAAVALAAARACLDVAGFSPEIKWPNDLLVGERKLAGILAEADTDAVVVGMGMNVASAPSEAAAVDQVAGRPVDRGELLTHMLEGLEGWCCDLGSVAAAYRAACSTIGRRVRVALPAGPVTGSVEGVDDGGNLLVRSDTGEVIQVSAGDVIHLRPT